MISKKYEEHRIGKKKENVVKHILMAKPDCDVRNLIRDGYLRYALL